MAVGEIKMFDQEFIELQQEILTYHRELLNEMDGCPDDDWPSRLGYLAGALGIAMDDMYTKDDLKYLAGVITKRLVAKRVQIILP